MNLNEELLQTSSLRWVFTLEFLICVCVLHFGIRLMKQPPIFRRQWPHDGPCGEPQRRYKPGYLRRSRETYKPREPQTKVTARTEYRRMFLSAKRLVLCIKRGSLEKLPYSYLKNFNSSNTYWQILHVSCAGQQRKVNKRIQPFASW